MNKAHPRKVGLVVGSLVALLHAIWSLIVATGNAKAYLDFVLGLHFINLKYTINAFDIGTAVTLVVVTGIVGYIVGYILALIWNRAHRSVHGK